MERTETPNDIAVMVKIEGKREEEVRKVDGGGVKRSNGRERRGEVRKVGGGGGEMY